MSDLVLGLGDALSADTLLFVVLGILLGYVIGVLPGLNRPAALAIAVPLSYYMTPLSAVAFLVGIAKASGAGGATTAILINVPGEPSGAATCLDGYPLARAGKAEQALKVALYGSVIGDVAGTIALIAAARPLATVALKIGPVEMCALMALAMTFIAALSGRSLLRGLAAGILGALMATVGLDIETATPRLTFGSVDLMDGVPLLAVTVGMLGLSEMFIQAEEVLMGHSSGREAAATPRLADAALGWRKFRTVLPTVFQSSAVGIGLGIIPGLGPSVASFASYAFAKRMARPGERFGEGELKGVAAAETADNAAFPAGIIPLFALGLPGSVSAAILIAAFMIHGVTPGPRIFVEHPRLIYGLYCAMLIASLAMLVVGRIGLVAFAKLTQVPPTIIIPVVSVLCIVGSYLETHSYFSVWMMFGFAVLGYVMHRFNYSRITFLIGFIIGPMFELALRQSLIITAGDSLVLLHYPFATVLAAMALFAAVMFTRNPR
jgi:putative tricarboxylic transport membrane protein